MAKLLWQPSDTQIEKSNSTRLIKFVNKKNHLALESYQQLYDWSVENIVEFWATMWEFGGIISSVKYNLVLDNLKTFETKWFIGAKLNYAENLLRYNDDQLAFISKGENLKSREMTYRELYLQVTKLAHSLRSLGITKGDRVAAYMPNIIETIIAMLAAVSIGATWASCGAELGPNAVVDRLGQIQPKILFCADGYCYKGKMFNLIDNIKIVASGIPSLKKIIVVPYMVENPDIQEIPNATSINNLLAEQKPALLIFEQVSADHPLFIMFSSGTTGKPKCMVQPTAGILINQLKDLMIHTDLKRKDRFMYITSASWMMWNFLTASLAVGATIVLFDGNPNYPDWRTFWKLIQDEHLTIFGCGASYIYYLRNVNASPGNEFDLSSLRQISQTGSALSAEGFEWVYANIKRDLLFNSITGGTDLNGTFASGTTALPVYAGQIQYPALGMKIKAYNEQAKPVYDQEGELVCEVPFPSAPLYFWDDPDNKKYSSAYFDHFKESTGKLVWRHGDYMIYHSDTGGITILGRSDTLLKPSGVRIGTAEIYNVVEDLFPEEIIDSVAIGQSWKGDQRIILFVKLIADKKLTDDLKNRLKQSLRNKASPRHVPAKIVQTPDIPYTFSGKKVEIAITKIAHGKPVLNRGALSNPESLEFYEKFFKSSEASI